MTNRVSEEKCSRKYCLNDLEGRNYEQVVNVRENTRGNTRVGSLDQFKL